MINIILPEQGKIYIGANKHINCNLMSDNKENSLTNLTMELFSQGLSRKEVEQSLHDSGYEEFYIKKIVDECVKLRNARKRTVGMALILAGAVCCLSSFFLTITASSLTESTWGLFGLTTLGVCLAFAGLMQIFS